MSLLTHDFPLGLTLCCDASITDCFHACLLDYQYSTICYQKYADLHEKISSFWYNFSSNTHIVSIMCQWSLSISHFWENKTRTVSYYGWWMCFTKYLIEFWTRFVGGFFVSCQKGHDVILYHVYQFWWRVDFGPHLRLFIFTFFMICGSFKSFLSATKVTDIVPVILNQRQDERRERWQAVRRSNSVGVHW